MCTALYINSIAHLLTDAVCAAALYGAVSASGDAGAAFLLYNTLAFSTQCAVGLLTDRLNRHEPLAAGGLALCVLGFFLPLPALPRAVCIGLGNSLFHVAGGTVTFKAAENRSGPLGVFVAPGAVGLALGRLYPAGGTYFALAATVCCCVMLFLREPEWFRPKAKPIRWSAVLCLLAAVAVRAVAGSVVSFPWKTGAALSLVTVLFVFLGKTAGGFIRDRLGTRLTAYISVPASGLLTALCWAWMLPSLAGQALINLTMPVTLWLLYRAMPDSPGLAFGLAASALWPGAILGGFIALTGPALSALVIVCFACALAAILYADRKLGDVRL